MGSKAIVLLGLFLATVLLISSEVAATRELDETSNDVDTSLKETNGAAADGVNPDDRGGRGGYGGGRGGYGGGRGGGGRRGGGYCRHGCCGRSYRGGGCRGAALTRARRLMLSLKTGLT